MLHGDIHIVNHQRAAWNMHTTLEQFTMPHLSSSLC